MNDFEIVVKGVAAMLRPFDDRVVIVETVAGGVPAGSADIALFDTFAGHRSPLGRIETIVEDRLLTKIVLYTWDARRDFADRALAHEVDGIISKSTTGENLVTLLESVHRGDAIVVADDMSRRESSVSTDERLGCLSEREHEVLAVLADGASNREIADELYVSSETIKSHVRSILGKLGAKNRTEAALIAHEAGFVRYG